LKQNSKNYLSLKNIGSESEIVPHGKRYVILYVLPSGNRKSTL